MEQIMMGVKVLCLVSSNYGLFRALRAKRKRHSHPEFYMQMSILFALFAILASI